MKKRSVILGLFIVAIMIFSCNSHRKITFKRVEPQKSTDVSKAKEKRTDNPYYLDDSQTAVELPIPEAIGAKTTTQPERKLDSKVVNNNTKAKIDAFHAWEKKTVNDLKSRTFGDTQKKHTVAHKKADREGDSALRIVLIIVLVFLILILLLFFILILTFQAAANEASKSCYIATMAYGDIDAPQVVRLRAFRDQHLVKSNLGRRFINWYYTYSPGFVEKHRSKIWLHKLCRRGLNGLLFILKFTHNLK